jgi:hypothetical protein
VDFPLVQLEQTLIEDWVSYGYLVAESAELVAVHSVSDRYDLDGWRVLRREGLLVNRAFERADVVQRAMRLKGLTPSGVPWLDLESMRAAIASVQAHCAAMVLYSNPDDAEDCEIGTVRMTSESSYVLRALDVNGVWSPEYRTFRYADVYELAFGGEYETTLARVAEDREG